MWCYRLDCEPIELNVTKIGAEKDFYGKELDDRITELESGFAPWLTISALAVVPWTSRR